MPSRMWITGAEVIGDAFFGIAVIADQNLLAGAYYHALARPWGPRLATDQVLGGGVLWILGDLVGLPFLAAQLIHMMREDESDAARIDAELDAQDAQDAQLAAARSVAAPGAPDYLGEATAAREATASREPAASRPPASPPRPAPMSRPTTRNPSRPAVVGDRPPLHRPLQAHQLSSADPSIHASPRCLPPPRQHRPTDPKRPIIVVDPGFVVDQWCLSATNQPRSRDQPPKWGRSYVRER